jgi:D-alanine-D-alanine ligase
LKGILNQVQDDKNIMTKKLNIAILFGGKSTEHEVSLQSAKNVINALNKTKYNPILIGIEKSGKWILLDQANFLLNSQDPKSIALKKSHHYVTLVPDGKKQIIITSSQNSTIDIDVIFPVLHGSFGEDGTIQGLLKLANIPFVGCDVLASSMGMDKDVQKRLLRDAKIPIAKFLSFKSIDELPSFSTIQDKLSQIVFVKPANTGSSVGISKVRTEEELQKAVKLAFDYDSKIVIEEAIIGREIECSVLGNDDPIASISGEVVPHHEFYSYEAKYIDENGASIVIPAKLSDNLINQIQNLAILTYKTLCCEGMARVDCFLTKDEKIFINEINTIPGFTNISMYPKLWQKSGISYSNLLDRLIQLALDRHQKQQKLKTTYI